MFWKNIFDMSYLRESEPEAFSIDLEALKKEFDRLDGDLRAVQAKYEPREKQVKDWNLPTPKEAAELKKIIDEKEAERKPMVDAIRPLNEKIQYCEQILALYEKCEEKDLEMRKYIVILKWKLKAKDYNYPILTGEQIFDKEMFSKKSNQKIGHDTCILG